MKVSFDIPEWAGDKSLYLMAGFETVAYRHKDKPWMIKTSRCQSCGKCCENLPIKGTDEFGTCRSLYQDGDKKLCKFGVARPFGCCVVMCKLPECSQRYELMEINAE
jgi:hypothetical protein